MKRNIRKLIDLGIIHLQYWENIKKDRRDFLLKFRDKLLESGVDLTKIFSKVIIPAEKLPISVEELDKLSDKMLFIPGLNSIYCVNEKEVRLLGDDRIILKEDVRGLPLEVKMKKCLQIYQDWTRPSKHESIKYTHEERRRIAIKYAEKLQNMPHIKDVYIVGSLAANCEEEGSDIDLRLVRNYCPGKENCLENLPPTDLVDIFCYTQEETEQLQQAGALITYFSIPYEKWKNILVRG